MNKYSDRRRVLLRQITALGAVGMFGDSLAADKAPANKKSADKRIAYDPADSN